MLIIVGRAQNTCHVNRQFSMQTLHIYLFSLYSLFTFNYLKMSYIYCIYFLTSHLLSCIFMYQTKIKVFYIKKTRELSYLK